MTPHVLSTLALVGLALLLGATLYESVVMAPNYEREIPASIDLARQFLKRTTPAHYFRPITPVTQLLLLASLVASWQIAPARWLLLTALAILVLIDAITFAFHYPRLAIMFKAPMPEDPVRLRSAAREWALGNILRVILLAVAFLLALQAVTILAT
jgi:Anthrone oxygenase